jgi:hypothetical protein
MPRVVVRAGSARSLARFSLRRRRRAWDSGVAAECRFARAKRKRATARTREQPALPVLDRRMRNGLRERRGVAEDGDTSLFVLVHLQVSIDAVLAAGLGRPGALVCARRPLRSPTSDPWPAFEPRPQLVALAVPALVRLRTPVLLADAATSGRQAPASWRLSRPGRYVCLTGLALSNRSTADEQRTQRLLSAARFRLS